MAIQETRSSLITQKMGSRKALKGFVNSEKWVLEWHSMGLETVLFKTRSQMPEFRTLKSLEQS